MTNFENIPEIKRWLDTGSINFFGLPFAGKDSQARRLAQRFGGTVLSSGDIFRNSVIPPETKAMIDRGELAPTQDFINIVLPYLQKPEFAALPLMLSSVGRWHGEEEGVIGALESANHPLKAVVYLSLAEEIAFRRPLKAKRRSKLLKSPTKLCSTSIAMVLITTLWILQLSNSFSYRLILSKKPKATLKKVITSAFNSLITASSTSNFQRTCTSKSRILKTS